VTVSISRNDLVALLDIALYFFISTENRVNKTTSKKEIVKIMCDSVNQTRFPKEGHLPDLARLGRQIYEG